MDIYPIVKEELQCTYKDLISSKKSQEFLCSIASTQICGSQQELFNFFKLYWCNLNNNIYLLIFLYLTLIFVILKITAFIVKNYIAEVITHLTESLKMTPSFAAVTLLAFANGAGDLITALVASEVEGGISYNIGALYGAGLFSCSLVIAICILQDEKPIYFEKSIIYRDIMFYMISTIVTLLFAVYGCINWVCCVILLSLYITLIALVRIQDAIKKKRRRRKRKEKMMKTFLKNKNLSQKMIENVKSEDSNVDIVHSYHHNHEQSVHAGKALGLAILMHLRDSFHSRVDDNFSDLELDLKGLIFSMREATLRSKMRLKLKLAHEYNKIPFKDLTFWGKVNHILDLPSKCLLYITALPPSEEAYSKRRCIIYAIPGTLFWYWIFNQEIDSSYLIYPLPAGIILMVIFIIILPKKKVPKYIMVLNIMSVISGLMWSKELIMLLTDILNTVEVVMNVPKTFLGLTVLAVGNGMVDAVTTITICKSGAGTLAISGGYMGQLFGYLVGFGASMLKVTLEKGPQEFDLFSSDDSHRNILALGVIGFTIVVLVLTFTWGVLKKRKFGRGFAWIMIGTYVLFILGSSGVALHMVFGEGH